MSIVDTGRSDPFLDMVKLMADPAELQKRMEAFRAAEERANSTIALVGPATEILAMRKQIEQDVAEAKSVLNVAREEAKLVVSQAEAKAAEIVKAAVSESQTAKAAAQATLDEAAAKLNEVIEQKAALEQQQAVLNDKMLELNDQIVRSKRAADEHEDAKRGFERSLTALRDIAGQFSTVLGKF